MLDNIHSDEKTFLKDEGEDAEDYAVAEDENAEIDDDTIYSGIDEEDDFVDTNYIDEYEE